MTILLIALWLLTRTPRRDAINFLLGAATGISMICLPFFIGAPLRMWHYVIAAQLHRPGDSRTRSLIRWEGILGLGQIPHALGSSALVLASVLTLIGCALALRRCLGRLAVLLLAGQSLVLLSAPSWFQHYAAFCSPALALTSGCAAGVLHQHLRKLVSSDGRPNRHRAAVLVAATAVLPTVLLALPVVDLRFGQQFPSATFAPVAAKSADVSPPTARWH